MTNGLVHPNQGLNKPVFGLKIKRIKCGQTVDFEVGSNEF